MTRVLRLAATALVLVPALVVAGAGTAFAAPDGPDVTIQLPDVTGEKGPGNALVVMLALTLLAVAPALLLMCTSFTQIIVVLSLTRNALGLQGVPPNQVLVGLALFLSFFIMTPVLTQVNDDAIQPYMAGDITFTQAYDAASVPLKDFMLDNTRPEELALMVKISKQPQPADQSQVTMVTLVPAFVLSQLRSAFIIGFVIFVPFLVIDMVVSAGLMSVGMMMLPPVMVSLPFKLLLFVLVDGWTLITTALVGSFAG